MGRRRLPRTRCVPLPLVVLGVVFSPRWKLCHPDAIMPKGTTPTPPVK